MRVDGIDVSYWQGHIDWSAVQASGIWWAATRIWDRQHGPGPDATFAPNRAGMRFCRHRLLYHYLEADRPPSDQVYDCARTVGPLDHGEGFMLDAETGATVPRCVEWLERVEDLYQRPCVVYTSDWVDGGRVARSPLIFDGRRARVFSALSNAVARAQPYGWDALQWSFTGQVPGVSTPVDLDQVDDPAAFDRCCYPSAPAEPSPADVAKATWGA